MRDNHVAFCEGDACHDAAALDLRDEQRLLGVRRRWSIDDPDDASLARPDLTVVRQVDAMTEERLQHGFARPALEDAVVERETRHA